MDKSLTVEELRNQFYYNRLIGCFIRTKTGKIANRKNTNGYETVCVCGKRYYAHRLAWFYIHGVWPEKEIDHENGSKINNYSNLRIATHQQNACNKKKPSTNKSGFKGVSWHKSAGCWAAHIKFCGKSKYLGLFETAEAASVAYDAKAQELFGKFKRKQ